MHIAIAGNIGVGKTTLAQKLADYYDWNVCFESVENNPYLEDFYKDMKRWAFHLQIYFLNNRFEQALSVSKNTQTIVQDRTIYEDAYIFAKNLRDTGLMNERDYQNYYTVFKSMTQFVKPPDLLIYLKADLPKLLKQIKQRGRCFESDIDPNYLKSLNQYYDNWVKDYNLGKILVIETNNKDFLYNSSDWENLLTEIEDNLSVKY